MLLLQGMFGACIFYIIKDNGTNLKSISFTIDGAVY